MRAQFVGKEPKTMSWKTLMSSAWWLTFVVFHPCYAWINLLRSTFMLDRLTAWKCNFLQPSLNYSAHDLWLWHGGMAVFTELGPNVSVTSVCVFKNMTLDSRESEILIANVTATDCCRGCNYKCTIDKMDSDFDLLCLTSFPAFIFLFCCPVLYHCESLYFSHRLYFQFLNLGESDFQLQSL